MKVNTYLWETRITLGKNEYACMSKEYHEIAKVTGLDTYEKGKTYFSHWVKVPNKRAVLFEVGWDNVTGEIFAEFPFKATAFTKEQLNEAIEFYNRFISVLADHGLLLLGGFAK